MRECRLCRNELLTTGDAEVDGVCLACLNKAPSDLPKAEWVSLPVPIRSRSESRPESESLPVPLRSVSDKQPDRPTSVPPRMTHTSNLPRASLFHEETKPPRKPPHPVVSTYGGGMSANLPPSAAQITLPEPVAQKPGVGTQTDDSRPAQIVSPREPTAISPKQPEEDSIVSTRSSRTDEAPPLSSSRPEMTSATANLTTAVPSFPPQEPVVLGKLAALANANPVAKTTAPAGRSPMPSSQNSASSQPGDLPFAAMFSMAASRQSQASQTPQALKLGWVIAGLSLAALLLLLTILVLVERSRQDAPPPLLPPTSSMQ